jgi:Kdo2-lipid IVA lauroyltransferase/acyltransferase
MNKGKNSSFRKRAKDIRSRMEYIMLRLVIYILRRLPVVLVRRMAILLFTAVRFRLSTAESNLKLVYPEMKKPERQRIIREMYKNLALTAVESYVMKPEDVFARLEFEGWDKVEKVLAKGKGVIIASGHLGNFEMAGRRMAHLAPLCVIVKRQSNRYFDEYANMLRLQDNCEPVQPGNALRPVLKKLKQNGLVVIMTDQNARYQGYQLNFLGHPASTHISAAKIAIKTGTTIITAGVTRNKEGYPVLQFRDQIESRDYEDTQEGYISLMQEILNRFGELVEACPEHWFWVHRRWRKPELGQEGIGDW